MLQTLIACMCVWSTSVVISGTRWGKEVKYAVRHWGGVLERSFLVFSWSPVLAFQTVSENTRMCPFKNSVVFFPTEPLQKGFRVSVGCTGRAAFSSSLSDSVRCCQLGQALWYCHKLSNSECDLITLKITCSKHFRGNQSVAAAKNEQGLKMLISTMMRKLWYLPQPLWLMEAPLGCWCLIKCYSKFWLQWQKLLVASWSCICLEVLLCVTLSFRICPGDQDVRQWKTGGIMFWWCEEVMSY